MVEGAIQGVIGGVASSLIAHPLTWYLLFLDAFFQGKPNIFVIEVVNPLVAIPESLLFSLDSLLGIGWLTLLVGGIVGGIMGGMFTAYLKCRNHKHGIIVS